MRPAYYTRRRPVRVSPMLIAGNGVGKRYIVRESSPYSLSMGDGLGFSWSGVWRSVKKPFQQVAAEFKRSPVFKAVAVVAGTALVGWGAWSLLGPGSAGASAGAAAAGAGEVAGATGAAAATGSMSSAAATAVAAEFAQGAIPATIGTYSTVGAATAAVATAAAPSTLAMIWGGVKTGVSVLSTAMTGLQVASAAFAKNPSPANEAAMNSQAAAAYAAYANSAQQAGYSAVTPDAFNSWVQAGATGEPPVGPPSQPTNLLPLLLVGGLGVVLLSQRR